MLLLLKLLTPEPLPTSSATNSRGLNRAAPSLIPKLLLLCRPDTLCTAIAASEVFVLVVERRRVGIIRSLLAEIGFDPPTAAPYCRFALHELTLVLTRAGAMTLKMQIPRTPGIECSTLVMPGCHKLRITLCQ